jgi:hypothetical protein
MTLPNGLKTLPFLQVLQVVFNPLETLKKNVQRYGGIAFALFEMKLVLRSILSKWQLELKSDQPIKPVRRGFTMAPKHGVPMRVVKQR